MEKLMFITVFALATINTSTIALGGDHHEAIVKGQCWLPARSDSRDFVMNLHEANGPYGFVYTDTDVKSVTQLFYFEDAKGKKEVIRSYALKTGERFICALQLK